MSEHTIASPGPRGCVAALQVQHHAVEFADHQRVPDVPLLVLAAVVRVADHLGALAQKIIDALKV